MRCATAIHTPLEHVSGEPEPYLKLTNDFTEPRHAFLQS